MPNLELHAIEQATKKLQKTAELAEKVTYTAFGVTVASMITSIMALLINFW